jgi:Na+/H+ antiporter NhaD/arsenite permease-like protein
MNAVVSEPRVPSQARRVLTLSVCLWVLRLLTAAGLAVDAYVHADLAATYDPVTKTISQGDLFRIEAGAAALAALLVLVVGTRPLVWAFALLVAAAGLAAVLLYRYVDVGALGPLPSMYEPAWYAEKTASAVAEAAATLTAAAGLLLAHRLRRRSG